MKCGWMIMNDAKWEICDAEAVVNSYYNGVEYVISEKRILPVPDWINLTIHVKNIIIRVGETKMPSY